MWDYRPAVIRDTSYGLCVCVCVCVCVRKRHLCLRLCACSWGVQALGSVKHPETILLLWHYINKIELNRIELKGIESIAAFGAEHTFQRDHEASAA